MTVPLENITIEDIERYIDPNFKHKYWEFRVVGLTCPSCNRKIPMFTLGNFLFCSCEARFNIIHKKSKPLDRLARRLNGTALKYPKFKKGKKTNYNRDIKLEELNIDFIKRLIDDTR